MNTTSFPLYLVIDQGGHASRALVFDAQGQIIATHSSDIKTRRYGRSRVEHEPEDLITSITQAVESVVSSTAVDICQIKCAGIATQRSSIVCWDRMTGVALSPVISWQDRRTADTITGFADHADRVHHLTGLRLSPHYGASKLKWCLEHLDEVKQAYHQDRLACGPLSSFILFRLLNERPLMVDPANASRTLLWNFRTGIWEPELLQLFGIPENILPQCVPNRYDYGHITLDKYDIPVTVVTGDQSAALYAFGRPDIGTVYINIGTGAFLQRPVSGGAPETGRLLGSVVWQAQDNTAFVLEGTVNGAGSALQQFAKDAGIDTDELPARIRDSLDTVISPPLFLNGISGLGSPFWQADFPSRFIGDGDEAEKLAAVVESIVFLIYLNLEEMNKLVPPSQLLVITGGLSAIDGLCQRVASLSGLPVKRPQLKEATARGLAFMLSGNTASGYQTIVFNPAQDTAFRQRFYRWLQLLLETVY